MVSAVIDAKGVRHPCTSVIVNADSAAVAAGLFGEVPRKAVSAAAPDDRSLSAVTWCAQTEEDGVPLDHHTVFFSR